MAARHLPHVRFSSMGRRPSCETPNGSRRLPNQGKPRAANWPLSGWRRRSVEFSQDELSLPVASYLWSCVVSIVQRQSSGAPLP